MRLRAEGTRAVLTVTDESGGIPPSLFPFVFEPFSSSTSIAIGLGLGLPIVRDIVERHRGQVSIESQDGTTVTVGLDGVGLSEVSDRQDRRRVAALLLLLGHGAQDHPVERGDPVEDAPGGVEHAIGESKGRSMRGCRRSTGHSRSRRASGQHAFPPGPGKTPVRAPQEPASCWTTRRISSIENGLATLGTPAFSKNSRLSGLSASPVTKATRPRYSGFWRTSSW